MSGQEIKGKWTAPVDGRQRQEGGQTLGSNKSKITEAGEEEVGSSLRNPESW